MGPAPLQSWHMEELEGSAQTVLWQAPRLCCFCAVVWRRAPSTSTVCGNGCWGALQLALCAEPRQIPSTMGRKRTKQIAQHVLAGDFRTEPRASGGESATGQAGEADRNTLWEQLVLQLGHSSAHLAMFEGAEGFLQHRQSIALEDLFLPWPPSLFGMTEEEVIHQGIRNFS